MGVGRPSWISDQNDFSCFDLQITPILPIKFRVNWPFYSWEEDQNKFVKWQLCQPSCISNRNDFSYFWSTSHLDNSCYVSRQSTFRFRKRSKNRISRWPQCRPSWIFNWNDELFWSTSQSERFLFLFFIYFFYFLSTNNYDASYQVSSQLDFRFRRRSEKYIFKIAAMPAILDFQLERLELFWSTSHSDYS